MKISIVTVAISLANLMCLCRLCLSDKHIYGSFRERVDYKLHDAVLIDNKTTEPRSYFIYFKYLTSHLKPIAYIEFDINSSSSGTIDAIETIRDGYIFQDTFPVPNFFAKIRIDPTSDVRATLKIYKTGPHTPYLNVRYGGTSKSVTFIYSKPAPTVKESIYVQSSIGQRQSGDELVHFQSRNVTNFNRFPSRAFQYAGEEYITYVGFSFNSPTAMILINTTYLGEKEFNTVVYDMNTEHFVANVSVYAMKNRSERRQGILGLL